MGDTENKPLADGYDEPQEQEQEQEQSDWTKVQTKVNDAVGKMVQNEKGTWEIPEDVLKTLTPSERLAVTSEKRFRDTQSAYTKARKQLKATETIVAELEQHVKKSTKINLTAAQQDELDELKLRDPDRWRAKLNEYEQTTKQTLEQQLAEVRKKGENASEAEIRAALVETFIEETGIQLTDEFVESEIPARIPKALDEGKITFDEFLRQVEEFVGKPKIIKDANTTPRTPNPDMDKLSGGSEPAEEDQALDAYATYEKETY